MTSTIKKPLQPKLVKTSAVNKTCNGGSSAQLTLGAPTVPSGYKNLGLVNVWFDATGTDDSANTNYVIVANHWDETTTAPKVMVRNFASSLAKFTINAYFLLVPQN